MPPADEYYEYVEQCIALALKCVQPGDKARLLQMAKHGANWPKSWMPARMIPSQRTPLRCQPASREIGNLRLRTEP